ncbi:hypothetical protein D1646_12945 [Pseudoflavonifractor sp. 60]|uniref:hypothetical protein n=1 Tax=Pseudoflavonifractor sp. 60 TaxID=2304576 RepID=UPI00136B1D41|nr:hypothetical protein [Pseudoflavonifractor sp. 60]NBI67690.1 hypothetical protein [Pseudoflavonifractor sp. 60]
MEIKLADTPEKFQPMAQELVPPLVELLRARNELELEIHRRFQVLEAEKPALGIPKNQIHPDDPALWEEYRRRYLELVEPRCAPGLLKYGAAGSCGSPARYDSLFQDPEGRVTFTMKSAKRATVETSCRKSWEHRYRFTLKPFERGWLIAGIEYSFGGETGWHAEHYV